MNKETFIKKRLKEHYKHVESLGYEVVGIFLQGSQNYNLDIYDDEYTSDIDTKCIVLPTLEDLIRGTAMTSKKYDYENEQIDVKDIRVMVDMWKKQNQSYLEILFTKYYILNPIYEEYFRPILEMKNEIVTINIPQMARCISGMSKEKVNALTHEYPSTAEKIRKYGYDPKQLASIIRLSHLCENLFVKNKSFKNSIWYRTNSDLQKYMIDIKKGICDLEEAITLSQYYDESISRIKDNIIDKLGKDDFNSKIYDKLKDYTYELIKFCIYNYVRQNIDLIKEG